MDLVNSSSDGEIKDDLSDISEDDYFDNIASKIEKRKLELELLNEIEKIDDYPKENHRYENHRNKQNSTTTRNNNNNNNVQKEKPRNNRNRGAVSMTRNNRASSVFSNYPLPKRGRRGKPFKKRRKYSRPQPNIINIVDDDDIIEIDKEDVDSDEELLSLRLEALTSKQEVKELIVPALSKPSSPLPVITSVEPVPNIVSEEEELRIAALRTAFLKKCDQIKERKKLKKLENERPYSPEKFEPITISFNDAMELSNSPLGSPFNVTFEDVDMDISNSSPPTPLTEDNKETSDMEIALSPASVEFEPRVMEELADEDQEAETEEEIALRSMLLSSIGNKKKQKDEEQSNVTEKTTPSSSNPSSPPAYIAQNLKLAVERIKQKKQVTMTTQKSGNKTIKMILEEKKKNAKKPSDNQTLVKVPIRKIASIKKQIETTQPTVETVQKQIETQRDTFESTLILQIANEQQAIYEKPPQHSPSLIQTENNETSFSTITDTKNIPLISYDHQEKKKKDRLVTSLESVIKPVSPLIISVRAESSEDEYDVKKAPSKATNQPPKSNEFEQNLDSFLKNIRMAQENKPTTSSSAATVIITKSSVLSKTKPIQQSNTILKTPSESAVKHLPLSSQLEYEKLLEKMQNLQDAKKQRQKLRSLKRTKSSSSNSDKMHKEATKQDSNQLQSISISDESLQTTEKPAPETPQSLQRNKIEENLNKISLLDEAARIRLIEKSENNYRNHSKNLMNSTEENVKMLEQNGLDVKRRQIVETKIADLEKTLAKYKNFLKVINNRIKLGVPKIIQSQRDMIRFRNRHHKFGEICMKVGENVIGENYRLPTCQQIEIEQNFLKISEKTEEFQSAFNEQQYTGKQLKMLAEKVKSFLPNEKTSVVTDHKEENKVIEEPSKDAGESCAIESRVSKLIRKCESQNNDRIEEEEVGTNFMTIPEVQKQVHKVLDDESTPEAARKKLKLYESPLEFLNVDSLPNQKTKSVYRVVCPFALEGSCNDENCKMLHL